ncbi:MAG: efflux RND transporter permease subunit [Longimicrobiales bacterium]|nr:efflux RND transporter permease subunit [Longimicrobiales bacterium]
MSDNEPQKGRPLGRAPERGALETFREFGPSSFATEHRTSILVLLAIIVIMGTLAYRATPKESFPELAIPILVVNTMYPGVSPADVESQVTRVIEEDLSTISEIETLTSTSVEGYSSITAEFDPSIDLDEALQKVREKVDLAKVDLPEDAEEPSIVEVNFSEVPVMRVNLSGDYGLVRLKEIAEELQDRLETIPSILRADLRGGLEREVQVDVDLSKMNYYGVTLQDVVDAIRGENVNIPGGSIDVGATKYLVRVDGEFENPTLIEELVVTTENARPIYVRDVAEVDFGFAERESFARMDGRAVVSLDVVKRAGENIIETAELVRAEIDAMQPLFPPTTEVVITSDASEDIEDMVSSLENNIISGLILIVGVLLFFLGAKTSMFVAVSIPSSMFLSFVVLKLMDVSMNMIVLFSLILALGMLVDNAIVVVENIYRFLEEGFDRKTAAKKATGEVAMPIIAATATTLAAFAPLLFWPGEVGEFMGYLPRTLIVTLTSSLFVALVIVPTLCAMFMTLDGTPSKPLRPAARWTLVGLTVLSFLAIAGANLLTAVLLAATVVFLWSLHRFVLDGAARRFQDRLLPAVIGDYENRLRWSLEHRAVVLSLTVAAFIGAGFLFARFGAGIEYFPENMPPSQLMVTVETPVGTRADVTDDIVRRLEDQLERVEGRDDWKSVVATTGSGGSGGNPMGGGGASGPESGRLAISLVDFQDRERDAFETLAEMQEEIGTEVAGATVVVDRVGEGPPQGAPVNIEIVGEDVEQLEALSDRVLDILENAPVSRKLVGLESDLDEARPELSVHVDREKAALYDLNTAQVGNAIRNAINGVEAAKYRTGNDEYDIIVRLDEQYRDELEGLRELTVMADGTQVPLVSVATWSVEEGAGAIRRKDRERMATITSDVASGYSNNAVLAEVQGILADFQADLPPGYTMQYTGQSQEQDEASAFLGGAFLTALLLIGFILISQFNSVVKPVIILTSVVMSTMGVLIGLVIFRMPFGIINTGVGIISLAGIVVNNAIILIDYIDILRERDGMNRREALVEGGKTRFRPVVLTALTTALGMVPLAIGLNFDFFGLYGSLTPELYWGGEQAAWWGPMAVAIIAGILFATFLTLVLVPVMYSLVDDFALFFQRHFVSRDDEEDVSETPSRSPTPGRSEPDPRPASPRPRPEPVGARRDRPAPGFLDPRPEAG